MIYNFFVLLLITQSLYAQMPDTLKLSECTLIISSVPSGAKVYIDNIYRGVTPITIEGIAVGEKYSLRLEKEGYEPYYDTIIFRTPAVREKEVVMREKREEEIEKVMKRIEEICIQAREDARDDTNSNLWKGIGLLGGGLGIAAIYLYQPNPPSDRLEGKFPEYVSYYTKCYKEESRRIRTKNARIGCVIGSVLPLIILPQVIPPFLR